MLTRTLILIALLQMFSVTKGSDGTKDAKKVVCYYGGTEVKQMKNLYPEDIDASICTHIVYMRGGVDDAVGEIIFRPLIEMSLREGEGQLERLGKLKGANPELKLILFVSSENMRWVLESTDRRAKIIKSAVRLLNTTSFDGMEFPTSKYAGDTEALTTFLCEIHDEFEKYGYILSTLASDTLEENSLEPVVERMSRCSSHITILTVMNFPSASNITRLIAPINLTRTVVDRYVEIGYPVNKLLISLPTFGMIFTLEDPKETGIGAFISGPGTNRTEYTDGVAVFYNWVLNKLNDTSEGWTIVRNEEADSPYAYSKTGKWLTYEDPVSAVAKARFVIEKNLGGVLFFTLDMSDFEGFSGKTFPVVRAVSDTFKEAASADSSSL